MVGVPKTTGIQFRYTRTTERPRLAIVTNPGDAMQTNVALGAVGNTPSTHVAARTREGPGVIEAYWGSLLLSGSAGGL